MDGLKLCFWLLLFFIVHCQWNSYTLLSRASTFLLKLYYSDFSVKFSSDFNIEPLAYLGCQSRGGIETKSHFERWQESLAAQLPFGHRINDDGKPVDASRSMQNDTSSIWHLELQLTTAVWLKLLINVSKRICLPRFFWMYYNRNRNTYSIMVESFHEVFRKWFNIIQPYQINFRAQ